MKKVILMVMITALMFVYGCGEPEVAIEKADVVFTIDGASVTLGEVYIYAETIREDYVATYGNDIWSLDIKENDGSISNMSDITKKDIIEDIVRVKLLCKHADKYGVHITDVEKDALYDNADSFYNNLTDAQISEYQLSKDVVRKVFEENRIAEQVRKYMLDNADIEVSFEEARKTTFYDMYFPTTKSDGEGNYTSVSDEEKAIMYEKALQAYSTLIDPVDVDNQGSIDSLAKYYALDKSSFYTLSPDEIKNYYGEDIFNMLYSLEDGSYSLVTETSDGYHIFYMKYLTDEEATKKNIEKISEKEEKEYFSEIYTEWKKETDPDFSYENSVDQTVYKKIKLSK